MFYFCDFLQRCNLLQDCADGTDEKACKIISQRSKLYLSGPVYSGPIIYYIIIAYVLSQKNYKDELLHIRGAVKNFHSTKAFSPPPPGGGVRQPPIIYCTSRRFTAASHGLLQPQKVYCSLPKVYCSSQGWLHKFQTIF